MCRSMSTSGLERTGATRSTNLLPSLLQYGPFSAQIRLRLAAFFLRHGADAIWDDAFQYQLIEIGAQLRRSAGGQPRAYPGGNRRVPGAERIAGAASGNDAPIRRGGRAG